MKKSIIIFLILVFCISLIGCTQNNSISTSATQEITSSPTPTITPTPSTTPAPTPTITARETLGITLKQFTDNYNREGTVLLVYDNYKFGKTIDQNTTEYTNILMNNCVYVFADCYGDKILNGVGIGVDKKALSNVLSAKGEDYISSAVATFFHYFLYGVFPSYSTAECDKIFTELLYSTPTKVDGVYEYYKQVGDINLLFSYNPSTNIYILTAKAKN